MFFFVSKVLYFLLCPLTWIVILLIIGVFIKNAKRAKKIFIAALISVLFFSNSALIDEMLRLWEVPYAITQNGQHYDAGIVLGGGMVTFDKDYDRLIFRENTDRFLQALDLYKKGIIKKIIVCGGPGSIVFKETIEGLLIERYLTGIGVPKDDLLIDSTSNNTHQNAVNCAAIIEQNFTSHHFLLITSSLHMKRAKACFEKEGISTSAYPTNKFAGKRRTDIGYYVIPEADALLRWEKYLHEVLGYYVYAFMGYL